MKLVKVYRDFVYLGYAAMFMFQLCSLLTHVWQCGLEASTFTSNKVLTLLAQSITLLRLIRVPDIMLPTDQLTSGSSTDSDILAIELDPNSFKLFETEPSTRIVVQPDLSPLIGNMNSLVSTWELNSSGNSLYYDSRETTGSVT